MKLMAVVFVLIDIKDNVSDTTSESSSLDLDFFAPSTTQSSEGKPGKVNVSMNELIKYFLALTCPRCDHYIVPSLS